MNVKVRQIEIDAQTAELLEARAAARGISISELLADIARNEEALPADLAGMRAEGLGPWSAEALEEDADVLPHRSGRAQILQGTGSGLSVADERCTSSVHGEEQG